MKAIFVIGRIASGKSTYTKSIRRDNDIVVELGDVVRAIKNTNERIFDISLNAQICEHIQDILNNTSRDRIIISSPRNLEIIDELEKTLQFQEVEYHVMDVPYEICKERFETSKRDKDSKLTYDEALIGDKSIGMEDLMQEMYVSDDKRIKIIKNY